MLIKEILMYTYYVQYIMIEESCHRKNNAVDKHLYH